MSRLVADSAGLIQERWADDFSIWSRLILHEVIGVNVHGETGIFADLAERFTSDGIIVLILLAIRAAGSCLMSGSHFVRLL